ncbi:F-box only protein 5 isoform X2 [Rhinatrema bivittatum]|nr:F-box only protein 5 isoform X2 [Rhinatrema bivittatum]
MKSHFDCKRANSSLSHSKYEPAKTQLKDACTPKYEDEWCGGCLKEQQTPSPHGDLQITNLENVYCTAEEGPSHNKENENVSSRLIDHEVQDLECSELQEDSGYSSLLHNQSIFVTEQQSDTILCNTPTHFPLESQTPLQNVNKNLLPALSFEEVVCSTLKKNAKRNQKMDWDFVDRVISQRNFGLQNLIGRGMGLDRLDILGELFQRSIRHLLAKILRHLSERDLINVARVSKTWKKIIETDHWAFQMYSTAVNSDLEARLSSHIARREYVLCRTALASIQKAATSASGSSKKATRSKASNQLSRYAEFTEAAKTLKNDESLKVCSHCGSPAKFDSYLQRATCKREGCGFDFCTKCLCDYHFSRECTSAKFSKPATKLGPLPGSRKSKQNLRRL